MKSIFPHFQRAIIEANKIIFLGGESPTLRLQDSSKSMFLVLNRCRRMRCFKRFVHLCKPGRELIMQGEMYKYRRQLQV